MLGRQDSSFSSSRRQYAAAATIPPSPETHHAKAIGCMSGIIKLFSKYQNPHKRLTFGRKHDKTKSPSPTKLSPKIEVKHRISDAKKLSCNTNVAIVRSPTLPPEIRRSNVASMSPRTSSSSLVAKLMGIENVVTDERKRIEVDQEPVEEKRRQLLQALEKCNEDLESLKRIIQSVQSANVQTPRKTVKCSVVGSGATEELSPVCVLDEFTCSPLSPFSPVQTMSTGAVRLSTTGRKHGKDDELVNKNRFLSKYSTIEPASKHVKQNATTISSQPHSRAMVQTVEEVCNDLTWGVKRETGRIGLVLQDCLSKELIEELVQELKSCGVNYSITFEGCKRRLCF